MNTDWQGFWKRWRTRKQGEEQTAQQTRASTDKQGEPAGSESQSGDRNELPLYPKGLQALLRRKLGLEERSEDAAEQHPSFEQDSRRCAALKDTYLSMRVRECQELEKKFEAFFRSYDDIRIDVRPLTEALRRERRISESEMLVESLYLVQLLERRLANTDPEILNNVGHAAMVRASDARAMLVEIFALKRRGVRDLAAHLDTIHRLTPSLCECLHGALVSSPGSIRQREEWEEFFLEGDRLAAEDSAGTTRAGDALLHHAVNYPELFSLQRAVRIDSAPTPSETIKAMLDWPAADGDFNRLVGYRARFFHSFRKLPLVDQQNAATSLREAVFDELVPEWCEEPLSFEQSDTRRWFIRILSFGKDPLAALFGEQGAEDIIEVAIRGRDRYHELNERDADRDERLKPIDDRLNVIEEQLKYLLGPDRLNWRGEFDSEAALNHVLDMMLHHQEKTSVYLFHEGSYPICSEYCNLLWDKAVSAVLLEQKITIVESPYEQWRWLEFMRKLSTIRLRSQHPGWRIGWR